MAQNGYLAARIYTSKGNIPIEGAVVTAMKKEGDIQSIAGKRVTDRNGQIPLITIKAPDESLSQSPGSFDVYSLVDVRVDKSGFYTVIIKNVQIFAKETTVIDTPLIPLAENETVGNKADEFVQTPQNL